MVARALLRGQDPETDSRLQSSEPLEHELRRIVRTALGPAVQGEDDSEPARRAALEARHRADPPAEGRSTPKPAASSMRSSA